MQLESLEIILKKWLIQSPILGISQRNFQGICVLTRILSIFQDSAFRMLVDWVLSQKRTSRRSEFQAYAVINLL